MKGMAPSGQHVEVDVEIVLSSGDAHAYAWSSPLGLARALHAAPRWARAELRAAHVRGRSAITLIKVEARLMPGAYAGLPGEEVPD